MFWKKAKSERTLFTYEGDCRRDAYRVRPSQAAPLKIFIGGEPVDLVDLSAGGFACLCGAGPGATIDVRMELPGEKQTVQARAEVLALTSQGVCHAQFVDLDRAMTETIHHFVLQVQKEELQRKRAEKLKKFRAWESGRRNQA